MRFRQLFAGTLAATILALAVAPFALALDIPPAPPLDRPIVDQTSTLSNADIDAISALINESRTKKDYQIGVLMIPTLGVDEYLEGYSLKVARAWGVGESGKDNGVLLLVVKNDHLMRIEVGRGLEGVFTDAEAGRITRNTLTPAFRRGDFAGGIEQAVKNIAAHVEGAPEKDTSAAAPQQDVNGPGIADILSVLFSILFWIIPWIGSLFARTKSWWAGGVVGGAVGLVVAALFGWAIWAIILAVVSAVVGLFFDKAVSANYAKRKQSGRDPSWWAGGTIFPGGGSSSGTWGGGWGGSGGGFGGGGFSGGGSSGSW